MRRNLGIKQEAQESPDAHQLFLTRFQAERTKCFAGSMQCDMDTFRRLIQQGNAREALRHARQHKIRSSLEVVEIGRDFVTKGADSLGDEAWQVYEQVLIAALDIDDQQLVTTALKRLRQKFPDSSRVDRLEAMRAESMGRFSEAAAIYHELLEKNPLDALAAKRLVCVAKAQGDVAEAVARLHDYLKLFQADATAWQELADLYLAAGDVASAVFALEELLLLSPTNFVFHAKLAAAYYTLAGTASGAQQQAEQLRLARKHYCQALEGHGEGSNLRALYGLCQTCYALASSVSRKDKASDGPVNLALFRMGSERIRAHYSQTNPAMLPAVERALSVQEEAVRAAA